MVISVVEISIQKKKCTAPYTRSTQEQHSTHVFFGSFPSIRVTFKPNTLEMKMDLFFLKFRMQKRCVICSTWSVSSWRALDDRAGARRGEGFSQSIVIFPIGKPFFWER